MIQRIREDIQTYREKDPAAGSTAEIVLCASGLHAIWAHRLAFFLWNKGHRLTGRIISHLAKILTGVEIHPEAQLGRRLVIDHGVGIVIGQTAVIGDDCLIYHGVTLGATNLHPGKRHPTLGNNVLVGAGVKILGNITIGDNARIGANAVVTKPIPEGATAVGIPAKIIDPKTTTIRIGA